MDSSASDAPFDMAQLRDIADGDTEFIRDLAQTFIEDTRTRIEQLRTLISAGDAEGIRREAHTIKGSSANFGAQILQQLATELEEMGTGQEIERAAETIEDFHAEFERLCAYADEELAA